MQALIDRFCRTPLPTKQPLHDEYQKRYTAVVMAGSSRRLPLVFFQTSGGREPVREWLQSLDREDRRIIGVDMLAAQEGWPLGLPLCRHLRGDVWEVRTRLPGKRIARVLFAIDEGELVILNGFMKTTQRTPSSELELALKRLREMRS